MLYGSHVKLIWISICSILLPFCPNYWRLFTLSRELLPTYSSLSPVHSRFDQIYVTISFCQGDSGHLKSVECCTYYWVFLSILLIMTLTCLIPFCYSLSNLLLELEFWTKMIKWDVARAVSSSSNKSLHIQIKYLFVVHQRLSFIEG